MATAGADRRGRDGRVRLMRMVAVVLGLTRGSFAGLDPWLRAGCLVSLLPGWVLR
jgi:hypothetical protein